MYAIRQTYSHTITGEHWSRVLKKRWKTRRGAEQFAQRCCRWVTMPDGKTAIEDSVAEVFEVAA